MSFSHLIYYSTIMVDFVLIQWFLRVLINKMWVGSMRLRLPDPVLFIQFQCLWAILVCFSGTFYTKTYTKHHFQAKTYIQRPINILNKINNFCLPTYPNLQHVTGNKYIILFGLRYVLRVHKIPFLRLFQDLDTEFHTFSRPLKPKTKFLTLSRLWEPCIFLV